MKKILFISAYAPPDDVIAAVRVGQWIKYLLRLGYKIELISAKNDFLYPQTSNIYFNDKNFQLHNIEFIPKIFKRLISNKNVKNSDKSKAKVGGLFKNFLRRLRPIFGQLDLYIFWIFPAIHKGRELLKRENFDYVISSFSPSASHIVASQLKKFSNSNQIEWIADFRDLWSDNPNTNNLTKFIEARIESLVLKSASKIITVSENGLELLKNKYPEKEIIIIENGFDPEEHPNWKQACSQLKHLNRPIIITYTGLISKKDRNPEILFITLARLLQEGHINRESIQINIFTQNYSECKKILNESALDNSIVTISSYIPRHLAIQKQKESDFLLLLESNNERGIGNLTGKVFEYIVSGVPIIAMGMHTKNLAKELVLSTGTGIYCQDIESANKFFMSILENKKIYFYKPDIKKIESYSRSKQVERLF